MLSLLMAALAVTPAVSEAATPQTTLSEIETEVMCPVCGTLLQLAEAPQAKRQKAFISRLIVEGKTEGEIKDALVAQYGDEVLALPRGSGFTLSAYLVPIIAFLVAVVALGLGIARWRRAGDPPDGGSSQDGGGPSEEDARRLDADLARYDL